MQLKPHGGLSTEEVAFRLAAINNGEMGDSTPQFWRRVVMPDGLSAWDWIQEWPELREAVFCCAPQEGSGE